MIDAIRLVVKLPVLGTLHIMSCMILIPALIVSES